MRSSRQSRFRSAASVSGHRSPAARAGKSAGAVPLHVYDVLLELNAAGGRRLRIKELASPTVLTHSRISRLVDELAAYGLLERCVRPRRSAQLDRRHHRARPPGRQERCARLPCGDRPSFPEPPAVHRIRHYRQRSVPYCRGPRAADSAPIQPLTARPIRDSTVSTMTVDARRAQRAAFTTVGSGLRSQRRGRNHEARA